ncbi:MAG: NAD(P)H-hydrate epimerase [Actinomycetes bacterium]
MDPRLAPDTFWPRLQAALDGVTVEQRTPPPDGRVGAVLVLLEPSDEGPVVVLTRRRRDLRSHPGQVSFPGGRLDPGETVEEAALREAEEEIGLRAHTARIVGVGPTFYIPPSRFWVVPVVARWDQPHELRLNPWEVDEILRVPVAALLERDRWRKVPLSLRGSSWAWQLDGDLLWGATAIVMALLLEVAVEAWSDGTDPDDLDDELSVRPWETAPAWTPRARLEGDLPVRALAEVPRVTVAQMRAVDDRLAELGLTLEMLAEHAGRALAHAVRRLVAGRPDGRPDVGGVRVTVLAGPGGNGAGGLAAARLLAAAGAEVTVVQVGGARLPWQPALLASLGVDVRTAGADDPSAGLDGPGEVVVDALLGIGADPPLRGLPGAVNDWLKRFDVPVVALDLPSGLGGDVGLRGACVNADVTVTLGAPKVGLVPPIVQPYVGDLYLADIGVPPALWEEVGVEPVTFPAGPLVRLTTGNAGGDAGTPDQAVREDAG